MASSSKPKTDEEIAKELAESRKVILTSAGGLGSGGYSVGTNGANSYGDIEVGREYIVRKDKGGREYIDIGGARAYWDEDKKRWAGSGYDSAGGNHRPSHFNTVNVAKQSSGGGGGHAPKPTPPRQRGKIVYPQGKVIDTGPVGGYAQNNQPMYNYYPVTQGQQLNPLVDPNNWLQNPDPRYGLLNSAGLYVNNPQPLGVLT